MVDEHALFGFEIYVCRMVSLHMDMSIFLKLLKDYVERLSE